MDKIIIEDLNLFYSKVQALKNINIKIKDNEVTSFIGPSGCGKSTLLRCLNRMNDLIVECKITGKVLIEDKDIYNNTNVYDLRKKVGMVFQKPNPFPLSIYDNVAYGARVNGIKKKSLLDDIVEESLKRAAIWDELSTRLKKNALSLSGGQQQRLCIARAMAVNPKFC